jgi:hypothetical protein
MNYAKPVHESVARSSPRPWPWPWPSRKSTWAIPHSAIAPIVLTCDALIIILASIAGGVAYHLYTLQVPGDILQFGGLAAIVAALFIAIESRSRKSAQGDKWSFCLMAGTLCSANQERP